MGENKNFSIQLNLPLDQSINPYNQTNTCPSYNSNITTTNNDVPASNMTAWDQQYLQPLAPVNSFEMKAPITANHYPYMMPPDQSIPLQHSNIGENSYVPLQEPANFLDAGGVILLDPNWEAIRAYLTGHVRRGADVTKVYRCAVCNVEYANPQALGGHMSAHRKDQRKNKDVLRSNKSKKIKKSKTMNLKKTNKSFVKNSPK